jgi:hypothetical protein
MVGTRDMNKVKMEDKDGNYPPVDTSAGRDVKIRQHPSDIPHFNLYYKIPDSNEIEAQRADIPQAPYPSVDRSRPTLSDAYRSSYAECRRDDSSHIQGR